MDTVLGDPTQIHQVIMNLCTNASYAMREQGGILEIELDDFTLEPDAMGGLMDLKPGTYVSVTVRGTGHGIAPDGLGLALRFIRDRLGIVDPE